MSATACGLYRTSNQQHNETSNQGVVQQTEPVQQKCETLQLNNECRSIMGQLSFWRCETSVKISLSFSLAKGTYAVLQHSQGLGKTAVIEGGDWEHF